jgi:hypothetical protein
MIRPPWNLRSMTVASTGSALVLSPPARSSREPRPLIAAPVRPATCGVDPDDDDLGDEEDLAVSEPLADEESNFDDFDDEFDDDFEEEENDPDWDHPEESEAEEPPPGKGGGRKK